MDSGGKAELISAIMDKLNTMSDADVLRVLAAFEASEARANAGNPR